MKEKERTIVTVNSVGPVYYDVDKDGFHLRKDCAQRLFANLEKSRKMEERREKRWRLANNLFQNAIVTLVVAGLSFVLFMLLTYAKQTNVHIDESIFLFYGFLTAVLAVVALSQLVIAKILERR